ncbi:hypothetical protein D3C87_1717710 [compost metagenome]
MELKEAFKEFNKKVKSKDYKNQKIKDLIGNREVDLDFYKEIVNDFLNVSSAEKKQVFKELISEIKDAFKSTFLENDKKIISSARGDIENLECQKEITEIRETKRRNPFWKNLQKCF